jgi:hypothetical protein
VQKHLAAPDAAGRGSQQAHPEEAEGSVLPCHALDAARPRKLSSLLLVSRAARARGRAPTLARVQSPTRLGGKVRLAHNGPCQPAAAHPLERVRLALDTGHVTRAASDQKWQIIGKLPRFSFQAKPDGELWPLKKIIKDFKTPSSPQPIFKKMLFLYRDRQGRSSIFNFQFYCAHPHCKRRVRRPCGICA